MSYTKRRSEMNKALTKEGEVPIIMNKRSGCYYWSYDETPWAWIKWKLGYGRREAIHKYLSKVSNLNYLGWYYEYANVGEEDWKKLDMAIRADYRAPVVKNGVRAYVGDRITLDELFEIVQPYSISNALTPRR